MLFFSSFLSLSAELVLFSFLVFSVDDCAQNRLNDALASFFFQFLLWCIIILRGGLVLGLIVISAIWFYWFCAFWLCSGWDYIFPKAVYQFDVNILKINKIFPYLKKIVVLAKKRLKHNWKSLDCRTAIHFHRYCGAEPNAWHDNFPTNTKITYHAGSEILEHNYKTASSNSLKNLQDPTSQFRAVSKICPATYPTTENTTREIREQNLFRSKALKRRKGTSTLYRCSKI